MANSTMGMRSVRIISVKTLASGPGRPPRPSRLAIRAPRSGT